MRVFNESKTQELYYYDAENGSLKMDKLVTAHHPAVPAFEGDGHYESKTYPNGGVAQWWVWDKNPTEAVEAWDETEDILVYVPFTEDQLNKRRMAKIKDRLAQLSEDFSQVFAGAQISDIDARKREFADLHNELRTLMGKEPRVYY